MAEQPTGKLAVIFHADVIGSTALVQRDERRAHERITSAFQRLSQIIQEYGGEVHEIRGDALLAEFSRASDAVCAALAFQQQNTTHNEKIEDEIIPEVRIGVALGEVVIADNTVTGAGVVLAQRVEQLCEPGGVYITEAIREALPSRLPLDQDNLGKHELKGFEKSVRVYAVRLPPEVEVPAPEPQQTTKRGRIPLVLTGAASALVVVAIALMWLKPWQPDTEPASEDQMAYALPSKPSIAVLPFKNLSGDPEQDYLAGGITEEIITTLSQVPNLFVIAGSSTDTYKDKATSAKQVAEEQGVRYVLEGSMQRTGDRIRVNTQLTDALAGSHAWAERYDREFKDLFMLQDEITRNIALAMQAELTEGDLVWHRAKGLDPEALRLVFKARKFMDKVTKENVAKAREILAQAQAISPDAVFPLISQGWLDAYEARYGWSPSREESLNKAEAITGEVLEKEETYPEALMLRGYTHVLRGELGKAIPYYELAADANPNHARAIGGLGWSLAYAGRPEEAIPVLKKAMRLSPYHPGWMDGTLGLAYMMTGEYELAIKANEDMIAKEALVLFGHERLAAIYALKGDMENARKYAAKVLELKPDFSIEGWSSVLKYERQEDLSHELNALRKAGLPEKPPLELPDKPSIAVLPFTNMSDDPKQEYFVDGMTEDLITDLSKLSGLFVIARNSVFTYKGKPVKVPQVAKELGVRYVLEGSVRKAGDQVRINAQLIDAANDGHLWAERYDGSLEDVFALQDQVTEKIVKALAVELTPEDVKSTQKAKTGNSEAYDEYLKGQEQYRRGTPKSYIAAIEHFERAIELDPDYTRGYASLAAVYWNSARNGWSRELGLTYSDVASQSRKYLTAAMKEPSPLAHQVASERAAFLRRRPDQALSEAQMAIALDSSDPAGHLAMAVALIKAKRPGEAVEATQRAMRLDPHYPASYLRRLGRAQLADRQFGAAATTLKLAIERNPLDEWAMVFLAAAYGHMDRKEKAAAIAQRADALRAELGKGALTWENVDAELYDSRYIETGSGGMKGDKGVIREGLRKADVDRGFVWLPLVTTTEVDEDRCVGCTLGIHTVYEVDGATTIDAETAKSLHERGVPFIEIDPRKWFRTRIPGAHLMDWTFGELNERRLSQIVGRNGEVVISGQYYERNAANAAAAAVTWGFRKVYYFPEGFDGWEKAGYPIERGK